MITRDNQTIFLSKYNVATPSIFRKEIFEQGARWVTRPELYNTCRFPSDKEFSKLVKKLGYWVAWNDKNTVINWGYNIKEWIEHVDYYLENYRAKIRIQEDGWKKRLNEHGYDLIKNDGKYEIIKL